MSKTKHKIEIEFTGTEFDYTFYLEGRKITLFPQIGGGFKRTFESFEVVDYIDIYFVTEGFQGTKCTLSIKVDGKALKPYKLTVSKKGVAAVVDTIQLTC